MTNAFMFPGQGSQVVGMGKGLAENFAVARSVFAEVDAALGQELSKIMWEGPEADLTLTENCQPALLAVSMAVLRVLETEHGITVANTAAFVAGHSLGEYSALAGAGTFTLADAAVLLRLRGTAMQNATPLGTGAMAAVLGLHFAEVVAVAAEAAQDDVCQAANDNSDGQVVISGHKAAIGRAMEIAKARGAKRVLPLTVSAPFHCALMQPAAEVMAEALANVAMMPPVVPVVANVGASPLSDPAAIRASLVAQVTGTVRWRECVGYMASQGVQHFYEIGSGRVLFGLSRKNAPHGTAAHVGTPEDITAVVATIKG